MATPKNNSKNKTLIDDLDDVDEASAHPDDGGELKPGPGRESFKLAQFWKAQIKAYEEGSARWIKRGSTVIKRFRDERNRIDEEGQRRMNLLWANFKVMKPAIYSKCPTPVVDRKFLDRDPTGRLSSQILERTLINELETNNFHEAMNQAVTDKLLPGRGVLWVRYVPKFGEGISLPAATINGVEDPLYQIGKDIGDSKLTSETEEDEKLEETQEEIISEKTEVDYIDWRDFYTIPIKARTWEEVQAIGKKVHISKKEAIERFGEKIGKALKPDTTPQGSGATERLNYSDTSIFQDINERTIVVFEVWNKSDQRVYWFSSGYDYLCDVVDDPLKLTGFFPVPKPLFSTTTNDTLIPVPDYIEWQDQAIQIDELTQRIAMLTKACKVAGVYDASKPAINRIFNESIENELIPVDQWIAFAEQGGLKSAIDFIPIEQIQSCIETLQKVRQQANIDFDQITGVSDVIRGTSDSRETLGGLRLKNNNAGTRLSENQEEVSRFARDVIRILSEIVSKHFQDETLIEASGILFEDALQPDTIMREWEAENQPVQPGGFQASPNPQQGGQKMLPAPNRMPQQQAPSPNVIPFPGASQSQQPGASGIAQGQPLPTASGMGGIPATPAALVPQLMQPAPPDPQVLILMKVLKAIELLRKDVLRGYRIGIETDSTVFGDKYQDRQDVNEFMTALGGYMKGFESIAENAPESMPMLAKALQWATRKYRVGRDLEAEIDNFVEVMTKKAKKLIENPAPSPEQMKAQAEVDQMKLEGQIQQQNDQRDAAKQQANDQREAQIQQAEDQRDQQKMMLDYQLEQQKMRNEQEKMDMEMEQLREKHRMEMEALRAGTAAKVTEHHMDMQSQHMEIQTREKEHKLDEKELDHKKKENEQKHEFKKKEQANKHKEAMKPKKKVS